MKDPKEGTLHSLNKDLQRAQDPHTLPPIPADKLNNSRHRKTLSGNAMSEIPFLQLSCTTRSMLNDWFSEVRKHLQRTVQISHVHEEKKKRKTQCFCTLNSGSFLSTMLQSQFQDRLTFFPVPVLSADQAFHHTATASPNETSQQPNTHILLILTIQKMGV